MGDLAHLRPDDQPTSVSERQTVSFPETDNKALIQCRASVATAYPFRNAKVMNWLYLKPTHLRSDRMVFVRRSKGQIDGFAAFKKLGDTLYLLEFRTSGARGDIATDILRFAIVRWRQLGGTAILVWPYSR